MSQGFDLSSAEDVLIEKGKRAFVDTKVLIAIGPSYFATTYGISALNDIRAFVKSSVYDGEHTGSIKVLIENEGRDDLAIATGDKIASLIITPVHPPTYQVDKIKIPNLYMCIEKVILPVIIAEVSFLEQHLKFFLVEQSIRMSNVALFNNTVVVARLMKVVG